MTTLYALLIGLTITVAILVILTTNELIGFFLLLAGRIIVNLSEYSFGIYGINASSTFGILIIFYAIFVWLKQKKEKSFSILWPYYVFLFLSLFSLWNSDNAMGFIAQFSKFLSMACIFIISYNLFNNIESGKKALRYFVFLSFLPMIYGFYQLFTGTGKHAQVHVGTSFDKIVSSFGHPNGYAFFLGLIIFAVYILILERVRNVRVYYVILGLALLSVLFTYSRSVWISITICSFLILIPNKKLRIPVIISGLIIFIGFSPLIAKRFEDLTQVQRAGTVSYGFNSLEFRIKMTKALFTKAFPEHPWVGFGLGSSKYVAAKYAKMDTFPHNEYMRVLIETGLLGFFGFLSFIVMNLIFLVKNIAYYGRNNYYSGLLSIIVFFSGIIIGTNQLGVIPTGGMWFCLYGIFLKLFHLSISYNSKRKAV